MSVVSLQKGGNVSLSKVAPGLKKARLALAWAARSTDGQDFDLDVSLFLVGANGKCRSDRDFIFYNQKVSSDGSIVHAGDNLTGSTDGTDGEKVEIALADVPQDIQKVVAVITIHDALARSQTFGQVLGAGVKLLDAITDAEVVSFDLSEDYSTETAMIMCELYRHNGDWKFKAVGQGFAGGLQSACSQFGITAA